MARTDARVCPELTFSPGPRRAPTPGSISFVSIQIPAPHRLGCATTPWLNKKPSQNKKHAHMPAETTPPRRFCPNRPGARGLHPRVRSRAPTDTTEKPSPLTTQKTPQPVLPEPPGGSGATPAGALARTRRQDKNPPDDSAQIARGLGGSCRVHKPGVPRGPAPMPGLGPGKQHIFHGPAKKN